MIDPNPQPVRTRRAAGPAAIKRGEIEARRAQAIAMRSAGQTWEMVAATLGYASKGAAHKDVGVALAERAAKTALSLDQFREQEIEHLQELRRKAMDVLNAEHMHVNAGQVVYSPKRDRETGDLILDPETREPILTAIPLRDSLPTLQAVDRLVKVAERMARLLGADQAIKVEVEQKTYNYSVNGVQMGDLT